MSTDVYGPTALRAATPLSPRLTSARTAETDRVTARVALPGPAARETGGPAPARDADGPLGGWSVPAAAVAFVLGAAEDTRTPVLNVVGPRGPVRCALDLDAAETVGDLLRQVDASAVSGRAGPDEESVAGTVVLRCAPPPESPAARRAALRLTILPDAATGELSLHADADADVVEPWFLQVFLRSVVAAVTACADPGRRTADIDLAAPEDLAAVAAHGAARYRPAEPGTLVDLIQASVRSTPDSPAIQAGESTLTYGRLWSAAADMRAALERSGVRPGDHVAVLTGKSPAAIPAILGILRAGAAYVPLDPRTPAERLGAVVADAGCRVIVVEDEHRALLAHCPAGTVTLPAATPTAADRDAPQGAPERRPRPEDRAYVIYTSGSTGRPKGVVVSHRAITGYLAWKHRYHGLGPQTRLLQIPSLAFDSSVSDVFSVLAAGGLIVLAPDGAPDPALLGRLAVRHGISHLTLVPSLYQVLVDRLAAAGPLLRLVTVAGEAVPPGLVEHHHAVLPGTRLVNEYGPTENSVGATAFDHRPGAGPGHPIGHPIDNTVAAVVAEHSGSPLPAGFLGEIRLAGTGLADGYLGRPDATAQAFLDDPAAPGGRWYRTGDRGWWRPDGMLEFAGRRDGQVKIRGYRVEVGEVESVLLGRPGVTEAAVVAAPAPDGRDTLVGYVVGSESEDLLADALRRSLPRQMVPSRLVRLPALPRLVSNKVDREALIRRAADDLAPRPAPPAPGTADGAADEPRDRAAGPGGLEATVAEVFREVLGAPDAGGDDDFFLLGGHSLLAVDLVDRIGERTGLLLDIGDVFDAPTVRGLAERLHAVDGPGSLPPGTPERLPAATDPVPPLLPAQRRMWLDERIDPRRRGVYHLTEALLLHGDLAHEDVTAALAAELAVSDALRLRVVPDGAEPRQRIEPVTAPVVSFVDVRGPGAATPAELTERELRRPFDLTREPPIRVVVARTGEAEHLLVVTVHHLACDGESATILMGRLFDRIRALRTGAPAPAAPQAAYLDYVAWWFARRSDAEHEADREHWRRVLAEPLPFPLLPADGERGLPPGATVRTTHTLDAATARTLRRVAAEQGATMFTLTLATAAELLHRLTGMTRVSLGTPVAVRDHPSLGGVVGPFLNTVPIVVELRGTEPFGALLATVRETVVAAMRHRATPFDEMVGLAPTARGGGRTPLFTVIFTLDEPGDAGTGSGDRFDAGPGLTVRRAPVTGWTGDFEFTLHVDNSGDGLTLVCEHDGGVYGPRQAARVLDLWAHLLGRTAEAPDRIIGATGAGPVAGAEALAFARSAPRTLACGGDVPRHFDRPVAVVDATGAPVLVGMPGEIVELGAEEPGEGFAERVRRGTRTGLSGCPLADGALLVRGRIAAPVQDTLGPVDPLAARERLANHPAVAAVAVTGSPDGSLTAHVQPAAGHGATPAQLRAHVRAVLPERLTPRHVVFHPELPRARDGLVEAPAPAGGEPAAHPAAGRPAPERVVRVVATAMAACLGRAEVDPYDDFFDLGGSSLTAIMLVGELHARLHVALAPRVVLDARTPAALAEAVRAATARPEARPRIRRAGAGPYPVTLEQADVLAALDASADPASFTVLDVVDLGSCDAERMRAAVLATVARHPALSSRLTGTDSGPVWVPADEPRAGWTTQDLSGLPPQDRAAALDACVQRHLAEPFDLAAGLLVRALLVTTAPDGCTLVLAVHHIAVDGLAMSTLVSEIADRYRHGAAAPAVTDALGMADVAHAERELIAQGGYTAALARLRDRLGAGPAPDPVPLDRPRLLPTALLVEQRPFRLPAPVGERLSSWSARIGCSSFVVLLASLAAALADGGADAADVRLATTISTRDEAGLLYTVGLLSTTAVLRLDLSDGPDDLHLIRRVRDAVIDAQGAAVPFALVGRELAEACGVGRADLARVLVVAQDGADDLPPGWHRRETARARRPVTTTYDLIVSVGVSEGAVEGHVLYKGELFRPETVDDLLARFTGRLQDALERHAEGERR
ncbi:amino acid adenylation domain-containing protein [Streptomyces sp. NPDC003522]